MNFKKFFIILIIFLFVNIAAVCANDLNSTQCSEFNDNITLKTNTEIDLHETNETAFKTNPSITIHSNNVKSKDTLEIYLKNSQGNPLKSKVLAAHINNNNYLLKTDSEGVASLNINLKADIYKLTISFDGDEEYNQVSKNFNIKVSKLTTKLTPSANFVVKKNNLYFFLIDSDGNRVAHKKITIKFNGKTFLRKSNSNGRVSIKINSPKSKYSIKSTFKGDGQYKFCFKKLNFYVITSMSLKIGNNKLLSEGFLRVYLKDSSNSVNKKSIKLIIGNKKLLGKTNSEGIVIFKPQVMQNHYTVLVKYGKYYSCKNIKCYEGSVKDPLDGLISYNGIPDIDVMPKNYVMGDENAKYTLTKSQYKEVLKRDSYCLFLNNKLTKYTFFKSKSHPHTNHIIKRSKWNVIEREINKKLVKANKNGYWPGKITVSLKGKSYAYPEVRDVQNTGYTCGPTSGSMCSQVLKNYVCEKYLAKLAGTTRKEGTKCSGIKRALEKNNFICTFYYKSSFKNALNELKIGGAALVFHANKHYVSILDISKDGRKVLVSNSYGSYDNIPTKWLKVSYMKNKFSHWEDSLIVRLNYNLNDLEKNKINSYYNNFGSNWVGHNTHQSIGKI